MTSDVRAEETPVEALGDLYRDGITACRAARAVLGPDMGPFEIAPGTQWDDGRDFDHEMFHHDMAVTRDCWAALPDLVRAHLRCPVVDTLVPIRQKHTIEGLVMGAE